jgi:predicted nucleic acid-binding protein
MILVDTNVIIELWKKATEEEIKTFYETDVAICGVVKSELLHGAFSQKNLDQIAFDLNLLEEVNIQENQWEAFGRFLYRLRTNGLVVPYADALIAFIAITNKLKLKTNDKHFRLIQVVIPELQLLAE